MNDRLFRLRQGPSGSGGAPSPIPQEVQDVLAVNGSGSTSEISHNFDNEDNVEFTVTAADSDTDSGAVCDAPLIS